MGGGWALALAAGLLTPAGSASSQQPCVPSGKVVKSCPQSRGRSKNFTITAVAGCSAPAPLVHWQGGRQRPGAAGPLAGGAPRAFVLQADAPYALLAVGLDTDLLQKALREPRP